MSDEIDPLRLAEYDRDAGIALTDAERWPDADEHALARLAAVRDHPSAPAWTHRTGTRLDAAGIARARAPLPLDGWLERCLAAARRAPAYRGLLLDGLDELDDFPLLSRDDLLADIGGFVPIGAPLERMVQGTSSGSTGAALTIPDDIEDVARTFWLLVDLLGRLGVVWRPDPSRLALAYAVHQRQAYTYASITPGFGDAPMARVNLHPDDWAPADRAAFLADLDPQVVSGDPVSLESLLDRELVEALHPLALVSGATHLSGALRAELEAAYGCPVLELYGLHETRPIAWRADDGPFLVLDGPLLVETFDERGDPVPAGERGELVVTAGANPLLPLVRYRTGDFGRLTTVDGRPAIAELEGREDVRFSAGDGREVPCVDLTQYLQAAGARGWAVVQHADGRVDATIVGGDERVVRDRLDALLHRPVTVTTVARLGDLGDGKPRRYRRESAS